MKRKYFERTRCLPGSSVQPQGSALDLEPGGPGGPVLTRNSHSDTRVRNAGVRTHPIAPRTRQTEGRGEQQRNCPPSPGWGGLATRWRLTNSDSQLAETLPEGVLEMWEGYFGWHSEWVFSIIGFIIIWAWGGQEIKKLAFEEMVCYTGPRRRGHRAPGRARRGSTRLRQEAQGEGNAGKSLYRGFCGRSR